MSENKPTGCPICGCTEYGFAAFPVCWRCGYAQEKDGRVVHPCGKSEEVVATLRAEIAERDALLWRVLSLASVESPCPVCLSRQPCTCLTTLFADIVALLGENSITELDISADVKLMYPQTCNNEIDELDVSAFDPQVFYTPTPLLDVDDLNHLGEEGQE